jgi:hypothetical protein
MFLQISSNVGYGMRSGFRLVRSFTSWGWLPLGVAAICWALWKCRNKVVFEKKVTKNPLEIICHACTLMIYWLGLFVELDRDQLIEGANTMLRVAKEVLAAQLTRQVNQLLLEDGNQSEQAEDSA